MEERLEMEEMMGYVKKWTGFTRKNRASYNRADEESDNTLEPCGKKMCLSFTLQRMALAKYVSKNTNAFKSLPATNF